MGSFSAAARFDLDLESLRSWAGIGVAGNFAGHLEQAGEAGDFAGVAAASGAPKGLFPFYVPGHDSFLATFPLSHDTIAAPSGAGGAGELQPEPEVALACSLGYLPDGTVESIAPFAFGAFDDCSIRRPGAAKISEKKNWGAGSKGVAARFLALGDVDLAQATATHRLACFLRRDGELHRYGVDSPLSGYSYYGDRLLGWLAERLADQHGDPDGPLEPVGRYLRDAGRPARALIAIGATRYTRFGESTRLEPGDESIVVVYDSDRLDPDALPAALEGDAATLGGASVLRRPLAS